jgi:hypothetical protein
MGCALGQNYLRGRPTLSAGGLSARRRLSSATRVASESHPALPDVLSVQITSAPSQTSEEGDDRANSPDAAPISHTPYRSDNGQAVRVQPLLLSFQHHGITPSRITAKNPRQNGIYESSKGTFREEYFYAKQFRSVTEARVMIEQWRISYHR